MTGFELMEAFFKLPREAIDRPVVMEGLIQLGNLRACRGVIFDPEMREIVILGKGPFD